MKVELNRDDCANVKGALLLTAKQPSINERAMKALLILSEKFNWQKKPKVDKKIKNK